MTTIERRYWKVNWRNTEGPPADDRSSRPEDQVLEREQGFQFKPADQQMAAAPTS